MKRVLTTRIVPGLLLLAAAAGAHAQAKPEDLIKFRQSGYAFMAWNMGRIKAQLDAPATFDKAQVQLAANTLAAVAGSGMGALFAPGTDHGTGWKPTRVKPEFWQKPDEVREIATSFNREVGELQKVAASGDVVAIRTQFGKVGDACKRCHDAFRAKE